MSNPNPTPGRSEFDEKSFENNVRNNFTESKDCVAVCLSLFEGYDMVGPVFILLFDTEYDTNTATLFNGTTLRVTIPHERTKTSYSTAMCPCFLYIYIYIDRPTGTLNLLKRWRWVGEDWHPEFAACGLKTVGEGFRSHEHDNRLVNRR